MASIVDYQVKGNIGKELLPQRFDIYIYQGDTFRVYMVVKDSAGALIDLTGCVGLAQIRNQSDQVVGTFTVDVNTPSLGSIAFYINDTSSLPIGKYSYDFQLTGPGGERRTYIGGQVYIESQISQ